MGKERLKLHLEPYNGNVPSAPPGFAPRTAFKLKKVSDNERDVLSVPPGFAPRTTLHKAGNNSSDMASETIDLLNLKGSLENKPWILYNQSSHGKEEEKEESESKKPENVTASWRSENVKKKIFEEVPVFHPTEEEFRDTISYVASIRPKAEPYGFCRILPPQSWKPPCLIREKSIWEGSKFFTQVQHAHELQTNLLSTKISSYYEDVDGKKKRRLDTSFSHGSTSRERNLAKDGAFDRESFKSLGGLEFTLETFKKYADDFELEYFCRRDRASGSVKSTLENIEGKYREIVENCSDKAKVMYADDVDAGSFGSGFPSESNSSETSTFAEYIKTGWNLNSLPTLPGSVLAYESSGTSHLLVPRLRVGMCLSSQPWRVEQHHLYFLSYMHAGAPKILYGVPGSYAFRFEAVKKHFFDFLTRDANLHNGQVIESFTAALESAGIPVYRCGQCPGEFVLYFPGAYHSAVDTGFNCTEGVNFAPLDWLPHGQDIVELYRCQGKKTSLSHDKLLLGAARDAVRAHWLSQFGKSVPDNLLKWKDQCRKDGILANALKSRVKLERVSRAFLCNSLKSERMDTYFDASSKRECYMCHYDLHLSAVRCQCSEERYSCLSHAKQFCSCAWSDKIALFRYELDELDVLVEALQGKLSAIYKWAKEDLGLNLHSHTSGNRLRPSETADGISVAEKSKQNENRMQDLKTSTDVGRNSASSIRAELRARILESSLNNAKPKEATSSNTADHSSLPSVNLVSLDSSDSSSDSSSSDSDEDVQMIRLHFRK